MQSLAYVVPISYYFAYAIFYFHCIKLFRQVRVAEIPKAYFFVYVRVFIYSVACLSSSSQMMISLLCVLHYDNVYFIFSITINIIIMDVK